MTIGKELTFLQNNILVLPFKKMVDLEKRIVATQSCPDKLSSQLFNESFKVRQSPLLALNVKRLKILLEMLQSADVIQYLSYLSLKYQSI